MLWLALAKAGSDRYLICPPRTEFRPQVEDWGSHLPKSVFQLSDSGELQIGSVQKVVQKLVAGGNSETSRERIGLLDIDDLEIRTGMGHHCSDSQRDALEGYGLDSYIHGIRCSRDPCSALPPTGYSGLEYLEVDASVHPREDLCREGDDPQVVPP